MEQYMIYIWGAFAILMIIIEIMTIGILQIWFAIGAICAGIVAWFYPDNYLLQLLVFLLVSTVLAFIGSKIFSNKPRKATQNPVFSILGKTAVVTKEIDTPNGVGQISVNGETWSAKTKNNEIIPENAKVKVLEIDGVKAVVEPYKEEN